MSAMDHRTRSSLALACVVLVTSAAAHLDGGGLLPHGRGLWVLVGGLMLLVVATRRLLAHRGGLVIGVLLGQGLTHLAYRLASCCDAVAGAPVTGHPGNSPDSMPMGGMAMPLGAMGPAPGTSTVMGGITSPGGTGIGGHGMPMLACHLVAVLVSLAVVAAARLVRGALRTLTDGLHDCLVALLAGVGHVVGPQALPTLVRRVHVRDLLLATTAPRRGPPVVA